MPVLKKIIVQDFRNIRLQELSFSPNVNCISGDNGEGKTNLLDAIWTLSMTKGLSGGPDRVNYRYGCDGFGISGEYLMDNGRVSRFSIQSVDGGKKLRRDDKAYDRISEHIGVLPIVVVSPSDISLVSDSGDERRRFVNAVLSQMDREYLADLQHYNHLLATRNTALKGNGPDRTFFEVIDERMSVYAGRIFEARKAFVSRLEPVVSEYYGILSSDSEKVGIELRSDLQQGELAGLLANSTARDAALGYTTVGVQRDDFVFTMNGYPIRRCGSQGQQKSFLVSLKFAQYEIMKEAYGFPPMLLLDDLFDKLDMKRVSNLLKMVAGADFGQIFITDSNKLRLDGLLEGITADKSCFVAKGGAFQLV